jgi:dGTPase
MTSQLGGRRAHPEPADPLRDDFTRDLHRIIESTAFRRLEGKTQVFAPRAHDHFRTRLTHTLEVAEVAACLAANLGANVPLARAIALAHDLGHPPFGHAGESALSQALAAIGGFNHNLHSLRVVEYLEHPFPPFRGLNLTAATRAGLRKHETRYDKPEHRTPERPEPADDDASDANADPHTKETSLLDSGAPSLEAQIANLGDRIAYNCHDLEDAIGASLIAAADLDHLALWQQALAEAQPRINPDAPELPPAPSPRSIHALRRPVLDALLNLLLEDVLTASRPRLDALGSVEDVLRASQPLLTLTPSGEAELAALEDFLLARVYRHPAIAGPDRQGRDTIAQLFELYRADPRRLPPRFAARLDEQGPERVIGDYIAGMTDRFCQTEFARLAGEPPPSTP